MVQNVWQVNYVRDIKISRNFCLAELTHALNKNLLSDYYGQDDRVYSSEQNKHLLSWSLHLNEKD